VLAYYEGEAEGMKTDQVLTEILKATPETKTGSKYESANLKKGERAA
jgi:hypothetical protein